MKEHDTASRRSPVACLGRDGYPERAMRAEAAAGAGGPATHMPGMPARRLQAGAAPPAPDDPGSFHPPGTRKNSHSLPVSLHDVMSGTAPDSVVSNVIGPDLCRPSDVVFDS